MTEPLQALEKEYCPPLDPALLSAIVSDYDLNSPEGQRAARDVLNSVKESAQEQSESGFDPSGTGGGSLTNDEEEERNGASSLHAESCPGFNGAHTDPTDVTSLSTGLHSLDIRSDDSNDTRTLETTRDLQNATEDEKVAVLQELFPDAKEYSIKHTLQRCGGNIDRAMDELLNHAMFDAGELVDGEEVVKIQAKGIEAFSEEYAGRRQRGKRKKKWKGDAMSEGSARTSSLPSSPTRVSNVWQQGNDEVELIARCAQLPQDAVGAVYHQYKRSSPRAIAAILDAPLPADHVNSGLPADDASLKAQAFELGKMFNSVEPSRLAAIVRLAYPSTAAAFELATALTMPQLNQNSGGIEVIVRSDRPPDDFTTVNRSQSTRSTSPTRRYTTPATSYSQMAAAHSALAGRAFDQAADARRRGRSDRLMGGAAAYYTQVGRDHAMAANEARGGAADQLVASQSGAGYIDLHGVSVRDAVRIAKAETEGWYKSRRGQMGLDGRVHREDGAGGALEIVTGVGRHSVGGRGVVGPAVGRMLVREGWNVRFQEGVVVVTGKTR